MENMCDALQPRVHGLALEGEDAEDALVDAIERLALDEALQRFHAKGELADGERTLGRETTTSEAFEVFGRGVLRAIDDAQVLWAATLDGRLSDPLRPLGDEVEGLYHHAFATPTG